MTDIRTVIAITIFKYPIPKKSNNKMANEPIKSGSICAIILSNFSIFSSMTF